MKRKELEEVASDLLHMIWMLEKMEDRTIVPGCVNKIMSLVQELINLDLEDLSLTVQISTREGLFSVRNKLFKICQNYTTEQQKKLNNYLNVCKSCNPSSGIQAHAFDQKTLVNSASKLR